MSTRPGHARCAAPPAVAALLTLLALQALLLPALSTAGEMSFSDFDRRARAGETLTVVFFGASLTWGANATDPQRTSYRARIGERLEQTYPAAHLHFVDAAIGGTGSQLGVFRLERDVIAHHPDLVFLDFSANDDITSADEETLASYEAIVRRLVGGIGIPVVQVLFPFQWNIGPGTLEHMPRRTAHLAIAQAYGTGVGDAIALINQRVAAGALVPATIWPYDGVHPGDAGYAVFAEAAWQGFINAVAEGRRCAAPAAMLYASTYTEAVRVPLASLGALPAGWHVDHPHLTSAFFDMLMSRWLDQESVAEWGGEPAGVSAAAQPLLVRFHGSMVLLFGESTLATGTYQASIDGTPVTETVKGAKVPLFDPGQFARSCGGNVHLVKVLASGLAPGQPHVLSITPQPSARAATELRLESICVAGPGAQVERPAAAP